MFALSLYEASLVARWPDRLCAPVSTEIAICAYGLVINPNQGDPFQKWGVGGRVGVGLAGNRRSPGGLRCASVQWVT
jgi:hypothetical protein